MSKFKVGDYARANALTDGKYNYTNKKSGWYGLVTAVYPDGTFDASGGSHLEPERFDLCDKDGKIPTFRFKVGDTVIGNSTNTYGYTGTGWIGTVVKLGPVGSGVIFVSSVPGSKPCTNVDVKEDSFDLYVAVTAGPFKVGDIITHVGGHSKAGYSETIGNFRGEVMKVESRYLHVKMLKRADGSVAPGNIYPVDPEEFKLAEPEKTSVAGKSSTSKEPQTFMEGVDVKIGHHLAYYDIGTEDYVGEVGNIRRYSKYSAGDGCWLMDVEMGDGELLEILENECEAYAGLTKPKAKPAFKKVEVVPSMPFEPIPLRDPGKVFDAEVHRAYLDEYLRPPVKKSSVGDPGFDLRVDVPKVGGMKFEVSKFDITPSRKVLPRLVF